MTANSSRYSARGEPRSLYEEPAAAPSALLTQADCEALTKKILGFATADETRVSITSSKKRSVVSNSPAS